MLLTMKNVKLCKPRPTVALMMWQLVYADGEKSHYEEHLIRQVADLLYLSQGEFIQARHLAETDDGQA